VEALASIPWVADGLDGVEQQAVGHLRNIARKDLALAEALVDSPFLRATFTGRDGNALGAVRLLQDKYPGLLAEMVGQDWFADGISDDEAALVTVFGKDDRFYKPTDFRALLAGPRMESRAVTLPLRGEIPTTVVSLAGGLSDQSISPSLEAILVEMETFMGIPFPVDDVIVLLPDCAIFIGNDECRPGGVNRGSYVLVDPNHSTEHNRGILIHELAHWYWSNATPPVKVPFWFDEGACEFLDSYVSTQLHGDSLTSRLRRVEDAARRRCTPEGVETVQDLTDKYTELGPHGYQERGLQGCHYWLSEVLFIHLYEAMGDDAFRSAWQDIYETTQGPMVRDMTEEEIYGFFLKHVPPDRIDDFKDAYHEHHGGDSVQ